MKKHFIYIFIFISSLGYAQQDISIATELDTTQIRIGEQFQYKISVDAQEKVSFPKLSNLGQLEVVSSEKIDTLKNSLVKKYVLTGFDSGSFYIPKQQVFIQDKTYFTDSLLVQVANVSVDTLKQKLYGIKTIAEEPMVFDDFRPYFNWFYLIIGILLLLLSIYLFLQKKSKKALKVKEVIAPYEEAVQKFTQLDKKELLQNNQVKEYYVELTEIIRVYLGREVNVHTLEVTTDEMIELLTQQNSAKKIGISKDSIQQLEAFLKHADFVKFAKLIPAEGEIKNDRNNAASLIEEVHPILDKYNTELKEAQVLIEKEQKTETKFSFKNLSKRSLIFISVISVLIIMILIFANQILQNNKAVKNSNSPKIQETNVATDDWKWQSFGNNPELTVTAPFDIALKSNQIPEQAAIVISELGVYGHDNTEKGYTFMITTVTYTSQVNPDLEQVMQSSLTNIETGFKLENMEFDREPASMGEEIQGSLFRGKATIADEKVDFKILGLLKDNKIWQIVSLGKTDDTETLVLLDTVMQSINIEKE